MRKFLSLSYCGERFYWGILIPKLIKLQTWNVCSSYMSIYMSKEFKNQRLEKAYDSAV